VKGWTIAATAKLFDFHFFRFCTLVFAGKVIFFTADGAFQHKAISHRNFPPNNAYKS
jgi:hypothetical protein